MIARLRPKVLQFLGVRRLTDAAAPEQPMNAPLFRLLTDIEQSLESSPSTLLDEDGQEYPSEKLHQNTILGRKYIGEIVMTENTTRQIQEITQDLEMHRPTLRMLTVKHKEKLALAQNKPTMYPSSQDFTDLEASAFLTSFTPQIYATTTNVLQEIRARLPEFRPVSVLDVSVGMGICSFVADEIFDGIVDISILESNKFLLSQVHKFHTSVSSSSPSSPSIEKTQTYRQHSQLPPNKTFDLVLGNHSILDQAKYNVSKREIWVRKLWEKVSDQGGLLVLLEPGTNDGFEAIAAAREQILGFLKDDQGAAHKQGRIIAPCPHEGKCALFSGKKRIPCTFSQRLQRPHYLQSLYASKSNTEDIKYSYLVLQKGKSRPPADTESILSQAYHWPRILSPPLKRKGHVTMDICLPCSGYKRITVPKSFGAMEYRNARKVSWGDLWGLGWKTEVDKNTGDDDNTIVDDITMTKKSRFIDDY
ncbi:Rsm22-cox11 tandem protein 2, mitochondrial [Neolecta irregularis DAH-3]|uniref:Rsm22-cox11 tandem protein 2, mitochondrial n=1 Tax=Neolecta irregularis (strain DAH-3) TaxID=1198029 RepID=A0A1U7LJY4_NEOID|nr:Rsm22-cox11 tandem protein 2, mitochondrial [Neolecta irregularis DAH-3]|eukprot:OLL22862.1 Rsm22-cox11 tandem protein 2, mitochondrial [Neolecta irregularis DAH-3]